MLLGLVALWDPPRPEVPEAVAVCRRAGIRVVMVTGDYGLTAQAIARRIGLPADTVVTGDEVERMAPATLQDVLCQPGGAHEPSSRLDVTLGEGRSALAEIVALVDEAGVPISSLVTLSKRGGPREAIVRVATIDPVPAVKALAAKGYAVRTAWRGHAGA